MVMVKNIGAICCLGHAVMPFNQDLIDVSSDSLNTCKTMLALTATLTSLWVHHLEWETGWKRLGSKGNSTTLCAESIRNEAIEQNNKTCVWVANTLELGPILKLLLKLAWQSHLCRIDGAMAVKTLRSSVLLSLLLLALFGAQAARKESNRGSQWVAGFGRGIVGKL